MSEEVLSKEEIDLLMETLEKKREKRVPEGVRPFDFDSLEKISPKRYIRLEQFLNNLSEKLEEELRKLLLTPLKLKIKSKREAPLSKALPQLSPPLLLLSISVDNVGDMYFIIDSKTAYNFISLMLGGPPIELEGKPFSRLELSILKRLVNTLCETIREEWNGFFSIPVKECETYQDIHSVDLDDDYFLGEFSLELEELSTTLFMAIPLYILKELKEEITLSKPNPEEKEELVRALLGVPLNLEVMLMKKKIPLKEVTSIEKEITLQTGKSVSDKVDVYVQGVLKFKGELGEVKGKRAVKIKDIL
ncbi:hypothetical protein JCM9492_11750 [Aquifex pyrophilus]